MEGLKTLVTISAWVLFIFAWVMLINMIIQSWFFGLSEEMTMIASAIVIVSFTLAAVAAKMRKTLE